MNQEEWVRRWRFGTLVNEVDVDAFKFRRKMGPLVHYFLFFDPVILVRPRAVKICGPFGGEAIIAPSIGDDIFGRHPCPLDLLVISLNFFLRNVDFERFDFFRHSCVCKPNACKTA